MSRKNIFLGILIILIIFIGSSRWITSHSNAKNDPTVNTVEEIDDVEVNFEYPSKVSYPGIKQFDIKISYYPPIAVYCNISSDLGSTSSDKIYLENENLIIYYFPNTVGTFELDTILFEFYDENDQLITDTKICIEYDKDKKQYLIFDMKIK